MLAWLNNDLSKTWTNTVRNSLQVFSPDNKLPCSPMEHYPAAMISQPAPQQTHIAKLKVYLQDAYNLQTSEVDAFLSLQSPNFP